MNKTRIVAAIVEALRADFETLRGTSKKTRAAGSDEESKAEGKYDTRSTEDNYLADGLARQALAAVVAAGAYEDFVAGAFGDDTPIDVGALVQLAFSDGTHWFFLGPAGGGIEVNCDGMQVTILTPESPLGRQLMGMKVGDGTVRPEARVRAVE